MKKLSEYLFEKLLFLVVKFSIYLNRRVFVMWYKSKKIFNCKKCVLSGAMVNPDQPVCTVCHFALTSQTQPKFMIRYFFFFFFFFNPKVLIFFLFFQENRKTYVVSTH